MLCDILEGWDGAGDGRQIQEGGDICIPVADSCVAETNTIYEPIFLQLKKKSVFFLKADIYLLFDVFI